jgi:hypothetical protein
MTTYRALYLAWASACRSLALSTWFGEEVSGCSLLLVFLAGMLVVKRKGQIAYIGNTTRTTIMSTGTMIFGVAFQSNFLAH